MRVRPLLIITAIVSSILGAIVVYLVLTVPNDIQAGTLLKQAKRDLAAGRTDSAKASLSKIVQEYPRTDAAAAATVAIVQIGDQDRARLQQQVESLRREQQRQSAAVDHLQQNIDEVKNAPPAVSPAPTPAPAKKSVKKAPAPKRRTHHTRRSTRKRRR